MTDEYDVVIAGAGAAGIAAGLRLAGSGLSFLIVEAAARVGGRAWTVKRDGMPLDLGCGWLHSGDRNPWTRVAGRIGAAIDRTPPAWGRQYRDLGFPPDAQRAAGAAYEAFHSRLRDDPPASDRAADALDPASPWNPYIDALSGYMNGVGLAHLSVADFLAYERADTNVNWRLPGGYGALIARAARELPILLDTCVTGIDRQAARLRVSTPRGVLSTRAVIVALPTPILARGDVALALDDKLHAASCLPLGLANKLFLAVDEAGDLPADGHLLGTPHRAETGSYYLRPFGRPVIEAFYGGSGAAALEDDGGRAMTAFAAEELSALFGSDFPKRLRPLAASGWGSAPLSCGSYSHALPGHADARRALAAPVEDRLFFAGEACSRDDFSTAHGAHATGTRAAEQALAALGSPAAA
ncbi:NAD(P)/FAD-dependent oxidoreductase [Sphingosinicella sp. BN140058]|uniref:flavin monoamine oxidase family protein n=1 Tax=Sphingosinicella sp. BN140058 TaxID=1892855 RepID=UPI001013AC57|nr:NAD(P)/FAD-dependent oxidoreductase [Sphingosinicella sp. BN140058]QAY78229.1 FAD-dependent oxidoreductase [Sphingosinicella sp. BN140058]